MTPEQLAGFLARGRRLQETVDRVVDAFTPRDPEPERKLHNGVAAACRLRGLPYLHGDMTRPTGRTLGEPDFVILLPGGRVLLVECKAARGKLSAAQINFARKAQDMGHAVHVVHSLRTFLGLLSNSLGNQDQPNP